MKPIKSWWCNCTLSSTEEMRELYYDANIMNRKRCLLMFLWSGKGLLYQFWQTSSSISHWTPQCSRFLLSICTTSRWCWCKSHWKSKAVKAVDLSLKWFLIDWYRPESVAGVEPHGGDADDDTVQSLNTEEDDLWLPLFRVELFFRSQHSNPPHHSLGQLMHPVLLILGQVSGNNRDVLEDLLIILIFTWLKSQELDLVLVCQRAAPQWCRQTLPATSDTSVMGEHRGQSRRSHHHDQSLHWVSAPICNQSLLGDNHVDVHL